MDHVVWVGAPAAIVTVRLGMLSIPRVSRLDPNIF
jgi:hypothetical protein